jgi:hypothetical protein
MMSACRLKHVQVEKQILEKSEKKCVKLVETPQLPQDARSTEYKKLIFMLALLLNKAWLICLTQDSYTKSRECKILVVVTCRYIT